MTQNYVATKIVQAWAQEQDGEAGYAVKYRDGYTSWCPADKFEEANIAIGQVSHMPEYQQRVIAEEAQLADRLEKLSGFLNSEAFKELSQHDQELLTVQRGAMSEYQDVLLQRIGFFGSSK